MKFTWTTLHVNDLQESLDFYQEVVGLEVVKQIASDQGPKIAFLGRDETKVELVEEDREQPVTPGDDISLGFAVDSLEDKLQALQDQDVEIAEGPIQPNPEVKFFFVTDPSGWKIQFVEISDSFI